MGRPGTNMLSQMNTIVSKNELKELFDEIKVIIGLKEFQDLRLHPMYCSQHLYL